METPPAQRHSTINKEIALQRLNGDEALLAALAGFFLEDAPQLLQQFHEGLRAQSLPQVVRSVHSLRGLASSFEATPVMQLAAEIEHLGQMGDSSRLKELAEELDTEITQLIETLQKIAVSPSSVCGPGETKATALRVLVVDDNIDAARTLAILLKANGYQVQTVHDGPTALKATQQFHPHLILLDVGLPGMNGYEVAKKIRGELNLDDVVLVAVTGYGQEEDKRRSREAGFNHHLVKPAEFNVIKQILDAVIKN